MLEWLLIKVTPLISKNRDSFEEFCQVFELACLQSKTYDLFVALQTAIPSTSTQVAPLLSPVLQNLFESEWATECLQMVVDETVVKKMFKFRDVCCNLLHGCPVYLIDAKFYPKIFASQF